MGSIIVLLVKGSTDEFTQLGSIIVPPKQGPVASSMNIVFVFPPFAKFKYDDLEILQRLNGKPLPKKRNENSTNSQCRNRRQRSCSPSPARGRNKTPRLDSSVQEWDNIHSAPDYEAYPWEESEKKSNTAPEYNRETMAAAESKLSADLKNMETHRQMAEKITKLEKENKSNVATIAKQKRENTNNVATIAMLRKLNDSNIATITDLRKENDSNIATITDLRKENESNRTTITDLRKENDSNIATITDLRKENESNGTTITDLRKENATNIATIAELRNENATNIATIADLRNENKSDGTTIADLQKENDDLKRQNQSHVTEIEALKKENESEMAQLRDRMKQLEDTNHMLTTSLHRALESKGNRVASSNEDESPQKSEWVKLFIGNVPRFTGSGEEMHAVTNTSFQSFFKEKFGEDVKESHLVQMNKSTKPDYGFVKFSIDLGAKLVGTTLDFHGVTLFVKPALKRNNKK